MIEFNRHTILCQCNEALVIIQLNLISAEIYSTVHCYAIVIVDMVLLVLINIMNGIAVYFRVLLFLSALMTHFTCGR